MNNMVVDDVSAFGDWDFIEMCIRDSVCSGGAVCAVLCGNRAVCQLWQLFFPDLGRDRRVLCCMGLDTDS